MKKQLSFIFIFLCFLLSLTACQNNETPASEPAEPPMETAQPEPAAPQEPEKDSELPQREKDWMEDIEFLWTEYKKRHLAPFYLCTEEEFDWKLDQLAGQVTELSDNDITFEIMAIIAGMGDVHTYVQQYAPLYDRRFPIRAEYFGGKLYLTACLEVVLVYKCGQEKLNNVYYQVKKQRRCFTWRKTRNLTLRNSSSRLWICIMPEEPRIRNWSVNMA